MQPIDRQIQPQNDQRPIEAPEANKQGRIEVLRKVGIGIGIAAGSMLAAALLATLVAGIVFMAMPAVLLTVGITFAAASIMVIASGTTLALGAGIGGTLGVICAIFVNFRYR